MAQDIFETLFSANGIIVWIAGIGLGAVLQIVMQEGFQYLLAKWFGGWLSTNTNLSGVWNTKYKYKIENENTWKEDDPAFIIKMFGRYLVSSRYRFINDRQV